MQIAEAYRSGREAIAALVTDADPATPVPACPAWSVHDLLAHLVGLAEDVAAGNVDDYASDAWTAAQVERRRESTVETMLDEWPEHAEQLQTVLGSLPAALGHAIVVDLVEHEQDLHEALRRSDTDRSERVEVALEALIGGLRGVHAASGLPSYRVQATDWRSWNIGRGEPVGVLRAPSNLLLRALAGRRPRTEVAALDWSMDPEPFLDHFLFPTFHWPGSRG